MTPTPPAPMQGDLLEQFNLLQNEIGAMTYRINEYAVLFNDPKRYESLHGIAPVFFRLINHSLWGDALMHLSRLTGRKTTRIGSHEFHNLTLRRLPDLVDPKFKDDVNAAVQAAVDAAAFTGEARNKVFAHADLNVARDPESSGITLGSFNQMKAAIDACEAALDAVAKPYGINRGTYFHNIGWGIAEDMVSALEAGAKAQYAENAARVAQMLGKSQ